MVDFLIWLLSVIAGIPTGLVTYDLLVTKHKVKNKYLIFLGVSYSVILVIGAYTISAELVREFLSK